MPFFQVVDKRTILADHRINRPLPDDQVTPSGRAARYGNDTDARFMEIPQRTVSAGGQFAICSNGVINITQHIPYRTRFTGSDGFKITHEKHLS